MPLTEGQARKVQEHIRSGLGTSEIARRVRIDARRVSEVRKQMLDAAPPAPDAPAAASVAPGSAAAQPGEVQAAEQATKQKRGHYARLLTSRLSVRSRVDALVSLATQTDNPQARMRALERADEISGFAPDPTPPPDPTPLFALPPDSMLPFPAQDRTLQRPARDAGQSDAESKPDA